MSLHAQIVRRHHYQGAAMTIRHLANVAILAGAAAGSALLTGCGLGTAGSASSSTTAVAGSRLSGAMHGGQQPISGASIQLYAAGSTGYGSSYPYSTGTSLLGGNVVTTDANGGFNITGDFTCPTANTPVYLVGTGGNPGLGGSANNPQIAEIAALGPCGQLTSSTFINMNEVTTVASIWALSPFIAGIANIGATATNAQGLQNAFASVNKVVNIGQGSAPGATLPTGASLPIAKINTLANILAACINSAGGTAGDGTACGTLFTNTTVNGVAPTDTFTAALNMAQNPNSHVAALINTTSAAAPFQPTIASATDLSLVISYSAGGFSTPRGIAVDPAGQVWVPNAGTSTVTQLDINGAPLSGPSGYSVGGLNLPSAIAIDTAGNAWVANSGNSTVSKIAAGGATGSTYSGGSMNAPSSIAIDAYGNVFVANFGGTSMTKIGTSGTLTNLSAAGIAAPIGIAVNPK